MAKTSFMESGVYLFPTQKDEFKLFTYSPTKDRGTSTYAEVLIDFFSADTTVIEEIVTEMHKKDVPPIDALLMNYDTDGKLLERYVRDKAKLIEEQFHTENPIYSYLIINELRMNVFGRFSKRSEDDEHNLETYRKAMGIIENTLVIRTHVERCLKAYAMSEETHDWRVVRACQQKPLLERRTFQELICIDHLTEKDLFGYGTIDSPFHQGFFLPTLEDYVWFIFLHFLMKETNLCLCRYCDHFFMSPTKRKARYCDRVQTEDGKTCKDIGPAYVKKVKSASEPMLQEYDRAMARNYKRAERTENMMSDTPTERALDFTTYFSWQKKVQNAKRDWIEQKITDEEFLAVIKELDKIPIES